MNRDAPGDPQDLLRPGGDGQPLPRGPAEPGLAVRGEPAAQRARAPLRAAADRARAAHRRARHRCGAAALRRGEAAARADWARSSSGCARGRTWWRARCGWRRSTAWGSTPCRRPSSAAWPTIPRSTCGSRTGAPTRCTRPVSDGEVDFGIVAVPTRRPQARGGAAGPRRAGDRAPPSHPIARRARCPLAALDGAAVHRLRPRHPHAPPDRQPAAPPRRARELHDGARQYRDHQAVGGGGPRPLAPARAHAGRRDARAHLVARPPAEGPSTGPSA